MNLTPFDEVKLKEAIQLARKADDIIQRLCILYPEILEDKQSNLLDLYSRSVLDQLKAINIK